MIDLLDAADCPECGATAFVVGGLCDVCFADLGERRGTGRLGAPAASSDPRDLRFSDVLDELRTVVTLARSGEDGSPVAAAGLRAERLLGSLRTQFLRDLGLPRLGAAGAE
jgi:hypothetical protein